MKTRNIIWIIALFIISYQLWYASWPTIITREQWWADETFTHMESSHWQKIIENRKNKVYPVVSKAVRKKQQEDNKKKTDYINENFSDQFTITQKITHDDSGEALAWKIEKSDYVNAIVVHHTHSEYSDSYTGIQEIYKYHTLSRQWWDIGYNYVIGYDGEIFEWRKWGDYTSAAHSKWNNISTVGIAIMGNYESKGINSLQYTSLELLIQELTQRYGIDLSKDYYYNSECAGAACNIFPLETYLDKTFVWHRDTWHTDCPWDELYKQIEQIRLNNLEFTKWFTPVKKWSEADSSSHNINTITNQKIVQALQSLSEKQLIEIWEKIDTRIKDETDTKKIELLKIIKIIARQVWETKKDEISIKDKVIWFLKSFHL